MTATQQKLQQRNCLFGSGLFRSSRFTEKNPLNNLFQLLCMCSDQKEILHCSNKLYCLISLTFRTASNHLKSNMSPIKSTKSYLTASYAPAALKHGLSSLESYTIYILFLFNMLISLCGGETHILPWSMFQSQLRKTCCATAVTK